MSDYLQTLPYELKTKLLSDIRTCAKILKLPIINRQSPSNYTHVFRASGSVSLFDPISKPEDAKLLEDYLLGMGFSPINLKDMNEEGVLLEVFNLDGSLELSSFINRHCENASDRYQINKACALISAILLLSIASK